MDQPQIQITNQTRRVSLNHWWMIAILLISSALLLYRLEGTGLWGDELFFARMAAAPLDQVVNAVAHDIHPPLYFVLARAWTGVFGSSDVMLRLFSVFVGILAVAMLYRVGCEWAGRATGQWAALLWGASPLFVLYARMARYYSLMLLLGATATLALLRALRIDRRRYWIIYAVASLSLLFTFYLSATLLIAHGLLAWLAGRTHRSSARPFGKWLLSMVIAATGFAPWVPIALHQLQTTSSAEATLLSGGVAGVALKIGYPLYAAAVGETIFPWRIPAMAGLIVVAILVVLGLHAWHKHGRLWAVLLLCAVPVLSVAGLATLFSARTPFVNMPGRMLFALPYIVLLIAPGIHHLKQPIKIGTAAVLGLVWLISLSNLYQAIDYLNPIYVTPGKQVAEVLRAQTKPTDIIAAEVDSLVSYYLPPNDPALFEDFDAAENAIRDRQPDRVWLVVIGRDSTRNPESSQLIGFLDRSYAVASCQGYLEIDPTYRALKTALTHQPAYRYRTVVWLWAKANTIAAPVSIETCESLSQ